MAHPDDLIRRMREHRVRPERDLSMAEVFGGREREARKSQRRFGAVAEAWLEVVPREVGEAAVLTSLSRGVLTVRVGDAPARFRLDRWLRAGGELELVKRSPVSVRRVRVLG
jgi:hypothetical protein